MRKPLLLLVALLSGVFVNAQTISHSVVSTSGANHTNSETGISISWTIGEPVIGTLSPSGHPITITQGFQQGALDASVFIMPVNFNADISVYPNPTTSYVNIQINGLKDNLLNLEIFDVNGRMMANQNNITGEQIVTINTEEFNPGVYLLRFMSGRNTVKTVRLVKQ